MNILKMTFLSLALIFSSLLVTLSFTQTASAQLSQGSKEAACKGANLSNTDGSCGTGNARKIEDTIKFIINLLSFVVGVAAVVVMILSGLKFITAGGDANSISQAKNGIIYAIVGLIVAALAQVIVRYVLAKIGN